MVDTPQTLALIDRIDAALPQTQCTKCGFDGCRPYAEAIVREGIPINQCPPGGDAGIRRLAALTGRPIAPLNPAHGVARPMEVARIDEPRCIGCTLCIAACPVDAILGAPRQMHVVVAADCSGCELCVPACPVDCISMQPATLAWTDARAQAARARYDGRTARAARVSELSAERRQLRLEEKAADPDLARADEARKRAIVAAAMARVRARRADAKGKE